MRPVSTLLLTVLALLTAPLQAAEPKTVLTLKLFPDYRSFGYATVSPDGKTLALFGSFKGKFDPERFSDSVRQLRLFSLPEGKLLHAVSDVELDHSADTNAGRGVAFSPDGKFLAFTDHDLPKVVDLTTGKVRSFDKPVLSGAIFPRPVRFTADSKKLALTVKGYSPSAGKVIVYDVKTGEATADGGELGGKGYDDTRLLAVSPDDKLFAVGANLEYDDDKGVVVHELAAWDKPRVLDKATGLLLGFLPDNKTVLTVSLETGTILQTDATTGKVTNTATPDDLKGFIKPSKAEHAKEAMIQLAVSADGAKLAISSGFFDADKLCIRVIDTKTGKTLATAFEEPTEKEIKSRTIFRLVGLTFTADGKSVCYVVDRLDITTTVRTLPLDDDKSKK